MIIASVKHHHHRRASSSSSSWSQNKPSTGLNGAAAYAQHTSSTREAHDQKDLWWTRITATETKRSFSRCLPLFYFFTRKPNRKVKVKGEPSSAKRRLLHKHLKQGKKEQSRGECTSDSPTVMSASSVWVTSTFRGLVTKHTHRVWVTSCILVKGKNFVILRTFPRLSLPYPKRANNNGQSSTISGHSSGNSPKIVGNGSRGFIDS